MAIRLFNVNDEEYFGDNVYLIHRPYILSNPYTHIKDKQTKAMFVVPSREEAIERYSHYFDVMYGKNIKLSIFGQSHSKAIGVSIDGLPAGIKIDMDKLNKFMSRRAPGGKFYSTPRKEADKVEFISGLVDNTTCGAPLCALIYNTNTKSSDYNELRDIPRPGHADYSANIKYKGYQDVAGGGHFSGRLTAPLCVVGGICKQILEKQGIVIAAHISNLGGMQDDRFDMIHVCAKDLEELQTHEFPIINLDILDNMKSRVEEVKSQKDSLGGIIECAVIGLKPGIGEPMFDGVENKIASIVFGIPAIKGIEFGAGFGVADMWGSENNDEFYYDDNIIKTKTNNHGGILGGITSGMPLVYRVAIKPTPSIAREQDSVSLKKGENVKLKIKGRHDPCIVPRAVPVIEAATAIALYDLIIDSERSL